MAGQPCGKCGDLIKRGEPIVYKEGKPIHYPECPRKNKEALKERLMRRFKEDFDDEVSAAEHYRISAEMAREAGFESMASVLEGIAQDEARHGSLVKTFMRDLEKTT